MKILGVIVTYHSDADRLIQNLNAVTKQIHDILLIDNGSDEQTVQLLNSLYERYPDNNIILKHAKKNNGIAWALRRGMEYANKKEYDWVLTLDQDSIMLEGLMRAYEDAIQELQAKAKVDACTDRTGAFTCVIQDRNFSDEEINGSVQKGLEPVKEAITSGFMISVEAYQKISGYDDQLFIDYVDYDVCYQLLEAGYQIYRVPYVGLLHEYGKVTRKKFLGKRPMVTNHPAWRNYYMVRNMYIMSKKHPVYVTKKDAAHNARSVFLRAVVYEQDKISKVKHILRGVREGKKYLHE